MLVVEWQVEAQEQAQEQAVQVLLQEEQVRQVASQMQVVAQCLPTCHLQVVVEAFRLSSLQHSQEVHQCSQPPPPLLQLLRRRLQMHGLQLQAPVQDSLHALLAPASRQMRATQRMTSAPTGNI